jgi:hypothetical protein
VAKLYGPSGDLAQGMPIAMVGDMVVLDADQNICSVLWRGSFPIPSEEALGSLVVVAGVELQGRAVAFPPTFAVLAQGPVPFAARRSEPPPPVAPPVVPPVAPPARAATKHETISMPVFDESTNSPATPFERQNEPAPGAQVAGRSASPKTMALSVEEIARRSAGSALPFADIPGDDINRPPPAAPLPPATPFERASTPPPPPTPARASEPPPIPARAPEPPPMPAMVAKPPPIPAMVPEPPRIPSGAVWNPQENPPPAVTAPPLQPPPAWDEPWQPPPPPEVIDTGGASANTPEPPKEGPLGSAFLLAAKGSGLKPEGSK